MSEINILRGDNLEVIKTLNKTYDAIIFDPVFKTLYRSPTTSYSKFIKDRLIASLNKLNDIGILVIVGYEQDTNAMTQLCSLYKFNVIGNIYVPVNSRGGYNWRGDMKISFLSINKLETFEYRSMLYHKAGIKRGPSCIPIPEAMPDHEVEKVTYFLKKINNCNSILDMFGGAGTVPIVCKRHNISCDCIEINSTRYLNIKLRLSMIANNAYAPINQKGVCDICKDWAHVRGLCSNHYNLLTRDKKKGINEIRGWTTADTPITSGLYF